VGRVELSDGATIVQTVGSTGYDGFTRAVVIKET
jgi:hypothetical protein